MNKKIAPRFYHTASGASPVLEWLRTLPPDDRYEIGQDLARVEFRCPSECRFVVFYLTCLWEVGSTLPGRRIARLIFCAEVGELFVLHGFIKKTQKTPAVDPSLAYKRMKEIKS